MKAKPDLPDLNLESVDMSVTDKYSHAVEEFDPSTTDPLSEDLEKYLFYIAQTGDIITNWDKAQHVFIHKLQLVLDDFYKEFPYSPGKVNPNCENAKFEDMKTRLINLASDFENPPFTFQRLCELVTNPRKNYTKCEKFVRAVEKNLMVVSPWTYPSSKRATDNVEELNGGFDSRASYATVDKPWSSLPPSPVTTSAPRIPDVASPNGDGATTQNDVTSSDDSVKDENTKTAESVQDNVDSKEELAEGDKEPNVFAKKDDNVTGIAADVTKQSDDVTTPVDVKDDAMEVDAPGDDTDKASTDAEAHDSNQSNVTSQKIDSDVTIPAASVQDDVTVSDVSKIEKKESLPGVGTLVEKHTVNRFQGKQETIKDDDQPNTAESQSSASDVTTTATTSCNDISMPSPKRKLSVDDDIGMEISSPIKRSKSEDDVTTETT